jgi:hypothetical protein
MEEQQSIREAVGVFHQYANLEHAIDELGISGFSRPQISVLGSEKAVEENFGEPSVKTRFLEDNPNAPRSPNIKVEELGIAQGVLIGGGIITGAMAGIILAGGVNSPNITTIVSLTAISGGIAGFLIAMFLRKKYFEFFQHQISKGGLLLWVKTENQQMEAKAQEIFKKYGAKDIHIHTISLTQSASIKYDKLLIKFDHIIDKHKDIINENNELNQELDSILKSLNQTAIGEKQPTVKSITDDINKAAIHAKTIAETNKTPAKRKSKKAHYYLSLAHDLDNFASKL